MPFLMESNDLSLVNEVRLALVDVEETGHYTGKRKSDQSCTSIMFVSISGGWM